MTTDLREELTALADTQTFSPDPSAWDRGRRVRRRDRVARGAAVVAVVSLLAGTGALALRPDPVGLAGGGDRDAAIPSVIPQADGPAVTFRAVRRASVAYVDRATRMPVLVDAATGKASFVELPGFPEPRLVDLIADLATGPWLAVSPDGRRVAYAATAFIDGPVGQPVFSTSFYRVVDLTTGDASALLDVPLRTSTPSAISWTAEGDLVVDVPGLPTEANVEPPVESWTIDPETGDSRRSELTGVPAPGGDLSAAYPLDEDERVRAVPFVTDGGGSERGLPTDLYPDGASVTPVGWAESSLLVAQIDAPAGSYVEGRHLALLTSPDRPESEWTYRILVRDVPDAEGLSLAVDLIPDLDGTSSQELTHDFSENSVGGSRWISLTYALAGVLAVLSGLIFIATMGRRAR